MKLKYFILIQLIYSLVYASALEFPTKCLAHNDNLEKACESLKKVKSTDTLVFATGEKMSGCFLRTKGDESEEIEAESDEKAQSFIRSVIRHHPKITRYEMSQVLRNPRRLNVEDVFFKDFSVTEKKSFLRLQELDFQYLRNNYPVEPLPRVELEAQLEKSKVGVLDLLEKTKGDASEKSVLRKIIEPLKIERQDKLETMSCTPFLKAFEQVGIRPGKELDVVIQPAVKTEGTFEAYPELSRQFVINHEVAHITDSCLWAKAFKPARTKTTFQELTQCLRDDIGNFKQKNTKKDPCSQTHTREAYCDHMSVDLLAKQIKENPPLYLDPPPTAGENEILVPKGYEAVFFLLDFHCSGDNDNDTHPSAKRRIQDIFARNSVLAKTLNCAAPDSFCDPIKGIQKRGSSGASGGTRSSSER